MKIKIPRKPLIREKDSIEIDLFTPHPLWKGDVKYEIVEYLLTNNFVPDTVSCISLDSRKGLPFSRKNIDEVFEYCGPRRSSLGDIYVGESMFLFANKPMKFYTHIYFDGGREGDLHNSVSISLESSEGEEARSMTISLFTDICLLLEPDFARIQLYTAVENYNSKRGLGCPDVIISPKDLLKGLPDIYGISVFGKPYMNLFGKGKILASPCYKVTELRNGLIWLQLSEHVFDVRGNKESLSAVRKAVKEYLNSNAFLDSELPCDHKYNLPKFDLSAIRAPIRMEEWQRSINE